VVRGEAETGRRIAVYTGALVIASFAFVLWEEMGVVYLVGISLLNVPMLVMVVRLMRSGALQEARRLFAYSNVYLLLLFVLTMTDAALPTLSW
jgi:protoheme IX farnesyltransferase